MIIYKLTLWTTDDNYRQIDAESVTYHRTYGGAVAEACKWVQYDHDDHGDIVRHMWTTPRENPMRALIEGAPEKVIYHASISRIEVQE